MIFVLIHAIFVQLLLLKILVCIFAETSNGPITYNIFIPLLMFVLTKLCVPSLPKISGLCLKPLSLMSDLNLNTIRQFGTPFSKKMFIYWNLLKKKFSRDVFIRCNIPFTSYADRLHKFGIKSREYPRLEFDVILMLKMCYNLSDVQYGDYFILFKRRYNLRSYELVIQSKFYASCDQFHNFFFHRIARIWNSLPFFFFFIFFIYLKVASRRITKKANTKIYTRGSHSTRRQRKTKGHQVCCHLLLILKLRLFGFKKKKRKIQKQHTKADEKIGSYKKWQRPTL